MQNNPYNINNETYGLSCACQNQEQGLGGWFSDAWQFCKRNAKSVGTIGAIVGIIMDVVDGACKTAVVDNPDSIFCRSMTVARDYTLTDAENAQVITWSEQFFSPFYNKILDKLNGVFVPGTTLDQQLKIINDAIKTMSIFKADLETNPNNFSVNANKEQFNGVTEFFGYVNKVVYDIIYESEVLLTTESVKVSSTGLDFSPLQVRTTGAIADLWKVANGGIVPSNVTLQPTAAQVQTLEATNTTPSTTGGDSNTGSVIVPLLAIGGIIGILALVSRRSNKKKK